MAKGRADLEDVIVVCFAFCAGLVFFGGMICLFFFSMVYPEYRRMHDWEETMCDVHSVEFGKALCCDGGEDNHDCIAKFDDSCECSKGFAKSGYDCYYCIARISYTPAGAPDGVVVEGISSDPPLDGKKTRRTDTKPLEFCDKIGELRGTTVPCWYDGMDDHLINNRHVILEQGGYSATAVIGMCLCGVCGLMFLCGCCASFIEAQDSPSTPSSTSNGGMVLELESRRWSVSDRTTATPDAPPSADDNDGLPAYDEVVAQGNGVPSAAPPPPAEDPPPFDSVELDSSSGGPSPPRRLQRRHSALAL